MENDTSLDLEWKFPFISIFPNLMASLTYSSDDAHTDIRLESKHTLRMVVQTTDLLTLVLLLTPHT